MRRFRKVRHVPLPLLAVIMAAILFAELARCEREGAKETAAEAEKSVPRRAALTFDDGPNACYTPEVLEILKENEIPATFFLQGQCLAGNEEIVRRMHAEGHLIGNHTFHHVQLTKVSEEEAREEVVKTSNAIYEITGEYPVYIRPALSGACAMRGGTLFPLWFLSYNQTNPCIFHPIFLSAIYLITFWRVSSTP